MHTDMEGSAVALGSLYALHALRSPLAVDCWLAITENRIGPLAYKPQDVVRAHNGTTIQVIHTDAEGRMVLADTLSLAAAQETARHHRLCNAHRRLRLCAHRALQRRLHQPAAGARPDRGRRHQQRRARLVLSHGCGLRYGSGEHRRRRHAVRHRRQGRSHSGGTLFEPIRAQGDCLAAPRSRGGVAPRRTRRTSPRRSPASACATRSICCAAAGRGPAGRGAPRANEYARHCGARRLACASARRRGARGRR